MLTDQLKNIMLDLSGFLPEMYLSGLFILVIILNLVFGKKALHALPYVVLTGLVLIFCVELFQFKILNYSDSKILFDGMFYFDSIGVFFKLFFTLATVLTVIFILLGDRFDMNNGEGEFYSLLLAMHVGLNLMVMSTNFLMVYVSVEIVSISSYVLAVYKFNSKASEGSLKYILYGAFASAISLYGMSLLYGITGTLSFIDLHFISGIAFVDKLAFTLILMMVMGVIFFKISAFPFQPWTPDVYESAPNAVVAFLSTAPKAAAIILLLRILHPLLMVNALLFDVELVFFFVSAATMIIGNFAALRQDNAKRMLAYSSIAHAGFILMAITAPDDFSISSILFYLCVYLFMNFAAFFMVDVLHRVTGSENIKDYKGVGMKYPFIGLLITFVLISLAGLPPTAGFYAKLFIFSSVWEEYQSTHNQLFVWLLLLGLSNTLVALFYYLRIPYYMFFKKCENTSLLTSSLISANLFVSLLCVPLVVLFFQPTWLTVIINKLKLYF